jgi:hypothetical protein
VIRIDPEANGKQYDEMILSGKPGRNVMWNSVCPCKALQDNIPTVDLPCKNNETAMEQIAAMCGETNFLLGATSGA